MAEPIPISDELRRELTTRLSEIEYALFSMWYVEGQDLSTLASSNATVFAQNKTQAVLMDAIDKAVTAGLISASDIDQRVYKDYSFDINYADLLRLKRNLSKNPRVFEQSSSETPPLQLLIDPGTAPPEEIAALLKKISKLYKMVGGSGITFTRAELLSPVDEEAPV